MLLLCFCVFLQICCVSERVLNKSLMLFVHRNVMSDLRRMLDNLYLAGLISFLFGLLYIPLEIIGTVLRFIVRNLLLSIWIMMIVALMVNVSESSSAVLSTMVNIYNSGVGRTIDTLVVKPLELLNWVYRGIVPLYNAITYMISQVFLKVVLPFFGMHIDRMPRLLGDFGLFFATTGRSCGILASRFVECGTNSQRMHNMREVNYTVITEPHRPFSQPNLQCIANTNYLTLDLMTPGLYARKTMLHVHYLLTTSCSVLTAPLDIVLYPFLDFNLYKAVHCFVNGILHFVLVLPLMTSARCSYGRDAFNQFSDMEQALMCTPDWQAGFAIVTACLNSLGKLIDNWLNIVLVVVEHNVGRVTVVCDQTATVGNVWDGVQDLFESQGRPLKVVGMSDSMLAVTDGSSTAFHSLVDGTSTVWALGVFPFPIDPLFGVAAVLYGEVFDADAEGDSRSGLFGCRCFDRVSAQGIESIEVVCSSVPFRTNTHDNDEDYAAHTVQRIVFDSSTATNTMTCARTVIRVSALRFSRQRFSTAQETGADSPFSDPFNAFGTAGTSDARSYSADAMLYVQPLCDGPRESCLANINNCFPWCMGLHVAGQRNQQIRVYNARTWEDFVTLAQTDCVASGVDLGPCQSGTGARVVNLEANFDYQSPCGVSVGACGRQDSTSTFMSLDNLRVQNSTVSQHRQQTLPMVRLGSQPFVAAGDVFLHQHEVSGSPGEFELVVSRLYDNKQGSFTMQAEQLSLLSNRQTVRLKLCDTEADAFCYYNALSERTIILPRSYMLSAEKNIAVTSEWAVHWAVNPENAIFRSVLDFCATGTTGFAINVVSSYSKPRVWSLKTMRAASVNPGRQEFAAADENGLYSYMVVPEWVSFNNFSVDMCDRQSNFQIVDLEYLNENNVLVTTLSSTMRNYRLSGGVCDGCPYEYKRYFLNPTRNDCVDPEEGDGMVFSCWRHERMGMFADNTVPIAIYGELCPALRRMPLLGSFAAETVLIATHSMLVVLEAMTTLITMFARQEALVDVSEIWALRMETPTFHSILDSSGVTLLDFDNVVRSLDKAALYASDVIIRSGKVFAGTPGYSSLEPMLAGTAKILQHTTGFVPLIGPLARQYKALSDLFQQQTKKITDITASSVKGKAWGFVSSASSGIMTQVSAMKVSLKLLKVVTLKQLVAYTKKSAKQAAIALKAKALQQQQQALAAAQGFRQVAKVAVKKTAVRGLTETVKMAGVGALLSLGDVFVSTIAENYEEIDRSFLDNVRVMCYGASQIAGTDTSFALSVKHSCLLFPDLLKALLTMTTVIFMDYSVMNCVCSQVAEQVRIDAITEQCMDDITPHYWRVWMMQQRESRADNAVAMCHSSMDLSNDRLKTAFDPVSSRLVKLVEAMQGLFNQIVITIGVDTGNCINYNSPYMVSIMPEPADYFMPCIHTPDCRLRCLDVFNAFDEALKSTVQEPSFVSRLDMRVESKYFSLDDIENGRNLPPFEIIGMSELYPTTCLTVCGAINPDNRCIAVVGTEMNRNSLGLAYYCIPADISSYVFAYGGQEGLQLQNFTWAAGEVIEEAFLASLHKLPLRGQDDVLVLTHDRVKLTKTLHLHTAERVGVILMRSVEYALETYNYITDMGNDAFVLNSVEQVFVMPATSVDPVCDIYIVGQKVYVEYQPTSSGVRQPSQRVARVCMHKSIQLTDTDFERPLITVTEDCTDDLENIFAEGHLPVCLNEACTDLLSVPTIVQSNEQSATFLKRSSVVARRFWEPIESTTFYAKRAGASSLAQLIGFDASRPLYVTAKQQAVVNKKHVSGTARVISGTRNIQDGTATADMLVTGTVSAHKSWIQSVRLRLDPAAQEFGAQLHTSTLTDQSMQIQVQCTVDNCVGCQTNPWQLRHVDLQSKCYAAARCGIQKCVATPVNMRKPLCNLGSVLTEPLHAIRILLHSGWQLIASTIIEMVELSKPRKQKHKWQFPSGDYLQFSCMAKNTIVEAVAIFTSTLSLLVRYVGLIDDSFSEDMLRSGIMDARWYGRFFMSTTALTNFIASLFLLPIYGAISAVQAMSCASTDLVALVTSSIEGQAQNQVVVMSQNDATLRQEAKSVAGVCLSQRMSERMREMGLHGSDATESYVANEFLSIINRVEQIGTSAFLSSLSSPIDAAMCWLIGLTSTFIDWVQTIDWKHCSLPSVSNHYVFRCVCGDHAHSVAPIRRSQNVAHSAFWCTGPLFMQDGRGEDRLIWNPYSLAELTAAEEQHAAFIKCISAGASCEKERVKLPVLERQSMNVMPVITQCRDNYKNKQWDPAVLTLGLFTQEQWLGGAQLLRKKDMEIVEVTGTPAKYQRAIRNLASLIPRIDIDTKLWQCLNEAVLSGNTMMEGQCRRAYTGMSDDAYFPYVRTSSVEFSQIDACLTYSATAVVINPINNATISPMLWSAGSANRMPVSERHEIVLSSSYDRLQVANARLETLFRTRIRPILQSESRNISENLKTNMWSMEGDELHQFVDCILIGPYASADLFSSFDTSGGGGKFRVPRYHRGDERSRLYVHENAANTNPNDRAGATGSEARRRIIDATLQYVHDRTDNITRSAAVNRVNLIRSKFLHMPNFYCKCPDGVPDMRCCQREDWTQIADIDFHTKELFADVYNIQTAVLEGAMDAVFDSNLLSRIWTSQDFTFQSDAPLTESERVELAHAFVFDFEKPVREYSPGEVPYQITGVTLWQRCTSLLSATFFTLPLAVGRQTVDANVIYDPTTMDSDAYLHGMEEVIQSILHRAREDSPVFWSHSHRYVASDSVWCESMQGPIPTNHTTSAFEAQRWYQQDFADEAVRGGTAGHAIFPGEVGANCLCGWALDGVCHMPILCSDLQPEHAMLDAWLRLCNSTYTNRDDLFDLMHILQTSAYALPVVASCRDLVPDVVWGLLSPAHQFAWYAQDDSIPATVSLKHIATHGPAGVRLGLFAQREHPHSLAAYIKTHDLLRRDPRHANINRKLRHTVAQPVCASSLRDFLKDDLSLYFRDVLFPMAHSVNQAPVAAYCSTWAVERTIELAMRQIYGEETPDVMRLQTQASTLWRKRCDIQLKQIGICLLRGVYDLVPSDSQVVPPSCGFRIDDAAHGCEEVFYVTAGCLVRCDAHFYDPCLCSEQLCTDIRFTKASCAAGQLAFNPLTTVTDDRILLYSMNWPTSLPANENGPARVEEMNTLLAEIHASVHLVSFDDASMLPSMAALIMSQQPLDETSVPHAHCDDLLDYFDAQAQHPVGYHPTCACLREQTDMRGFDAWMSMPHNTSKAWAVDPVRMRNMTEYSTSFGASHLACDAAVYGAYDHQLNALDLVSRWDNTAVADATVPRAARIVHEADMSTLGSPSGHQFDTPLVPADRSDIAWRHSTGLVRDWVSLYGPDADLEAALDQLWPHWLDNEVDTYGTAEQRTPDSCMMPPLMLCVPNTADCCSGIENCGLECRTRGEDGPEGLIDSTSGICVATGTCFQHRHCDEDMLCSGEGVCVEARLYLHNNMGVSVDAQLFSDDRVSCPMSTAGFSAHEGIRDFAKSHGMCGFRDWYEYQNLTQSMLPGPDGLLHVPDQTVHRTDSHAPQTLRLAKTLQMQAHACDRSYQHTDMGVCIDDDEMRVRASRVYETEDPVTPVAPVNHVTAIRTWQDSDAAAVIRFCDMGRSLSRTNAINGFLSPYEYEDAVTGLRQDTLHDVPATLGRCIDFAVCEAQRFTVQGLPVQERLVRQVRYEEARILLSDDHRAYTHADAEACFGAGHLLLSEDTFERCVVDRMTVPLLNVLFTTTPQFLAYHTEFYSDNILSAQWSHQAQTDAFLRLRQRCPRAMSQPIDDRVDFALFTHMLKMLSSTYPPDDAAIVTRYVNLLLPAIFGVDAERARDSTRGFDDISQYLELAVCARHIDTQMQLSKESLFTTNQAYTAESVLQQQLVGDSLYVFHARAVVYLPFRWFWQCVVLTRSPANSEKGAVRDWLRSLTDETYTVSQEQCEIFTLDIPSTELISVKLRLQSSPHIYTVTDDIPEMAAAMAHDIDDTVGLALSAYGLPMFPDVYYMRKRDDYDCLHHNLFVLRSCWHKYGRDASEIVDAEELIQTPDGGTVRSLYHMMRLLIFGVDAYTRDLHDFTLADLESDGVVALSLSLDTMVLAGTDFFPAIRFLHLDAYTQTPSSQQPIQGDTVDPLYAVCVENCDEVAPEFRLKQFEYRVQDENTVRIDAYANNNRDRSVVTASEAEYLLVQGFRKFIYFQSSFASNNVHRDTRVSRSFMSSHGLTQLESTAAREYNSFMRTKTFKCGASIEHNLPTNRLHATLAQCVSNLQEAVGWTIPAGSLLHLHVSAAVLRRGFMLSFSETRAANTKFLQNLTSPAWASKEYIAAFDTMCFSYRGETSTINPYWAVNYDTETGCDTYVRDVLRLTDGRCLTESASQTCADRFPFFDKALSSKLPAFCRAHANEVNTGRRGTLRAGVTELCDRTPDSPDQCLLRHGSFAGFLGSPVPDLNSFHVTRKQQGLWKFSNSIFRGSVFREANADHIDALQLLPTDIAGHSLGFVVDASGQLVLHCVNLVGVALESCLVSNQHWMYNLEEKWAWQHARQQALWPANANTGAMPWTCPLHLVQAHSGFGNERSIRSPSPDRNAFRFQHITAPSKYAHPIVAGARALLLMPARYMSPSSACTADLAGMSACHSSELLLRSLAHARELIWQTVLYPKYHSSPGVSCEQILDWPHQPFLTWDEQIGLGTVYERLHCSVLDRLPQFQVQLEERVSPRQHSGRSSVDSGGVCHMGRLKRMPARVPNADVLQHCAQTANGLACRYFDPVTHASYVRKEASSDNSATALHSQVFKNKPCAKCESHREAAFIDTDGMSRDLPDSRRMLSTGEKMQISTARMVSAYLRRLVCPVAAEAPCAELLRIFNTEHWTTGGFLQGLFAASNSTDFYNSFRPAPEPASSEEDVMDDELLWQRNWVWCDPRTEVCTGSIDKQVWINPRTRGPACRAAIAQNAVHAASTVHFCMIDAGTERLCQQVVEWNAEIANILCRAAGLAACTDSGFFYNPAGYSADNRQFEHDSVRDYYRSTNTCNGLEAESTMMTELQLRSNERLLAKCASVGLQPFLIFLLNMREAVHLIVELIYYGVQIVFNFVHMIVLGLLHIQVGVQAAANKIILYIRLFLDTVSEVLDLIYSAIFEMLFGGGENKRIVVILRFLCKAVQFIEEYVITKGLCVVLETLSSVYKWLYDILLQICNVELLNVKIFAWLYPIVGNVLVFAQNVLNIMLTITCHSPRINCEAGPYEVADDTSRGTLPMASRCWSTYTTFFGDGQSLSCTAADTCKRSLTDSTLVMCGVCPLQSPPNPLIFQYGCDTIIKTCTCGTPRLKPTFCYSNAECDAPGQSCMFVDSDLEPTEARTMCESCTTRPLCMLPQGSSVGQCACGLRELESARCRPEDVGSLVALPYSKLCVMQTDARYSASVSYTANFAEASVTPCMAVDASTSYCMRMVDLLDTFLIVSSHTQQSRRLLLDVGSTSVMRLNASFTRNPQCKDALESESESHVRRQCVNRYILSAGTVAHIGLHADVSACAFCSAEDWWNTLARDPMILPFLLVHPQKLWYVLLRHTSLARVLHTANSLRQKTQDIWSLLGQTNLSDYIGINTSATGILLTSKNTRVLSHHMVMLLQAMLRGHAEAGNASTFLMGSRLEWGWRQEHTALVDHAHLLDTPEDTTLSPPLSQHNWSAARKLLSLDSLARDVEIEVQRAFAIQNTYTSQISSAFDYNFPLAYSPETDQWLDSWPPTLGSSAPGTDQTCAPAVQLTHIAYYAFGNASKAYQVQAFPAKVTLREAFPRLRNASTSSQPMRSNAALTPASDAQVTIHEPLVSGMMWLLDQGASALGLRKTLFYDVVYSIFYEIENNIVCDLEAVQTCSKWTVSMGHGLVVILVYFFVLIVLLSAFKLETFSMFAVPFLWIMLFRVCYGYAWTCAPLLPLCLFEDLYTTISAVFPKHLQIPQTLWRDTSCADLGVVEPACLKTCQDEPFAFNDMQSVVAWALAETGANVSQAVSVARRIPTVNATILREQLLRSEKVLEDNDDSLVSSNRLCAAINSYRLVPYIALAFLALALLVLVLRVVLSLCFSAFTNAFAIFLPSFTR